MFLLNHYNYDLPKGYIAQKPVVNREQSRLFFLNRKTGKSTHYRFYDIVDLIRPSDVLVVNDTRVIPARLAGNKETGGKVEVFLLEYPGNEIRKADAGEFICRCLIKASKRPKNQSIINFEKGLKAKIIGFKDGIFNIGFLFKGDFKEVIEKIGHVPLPPYIKRMDNAGDKTAYQTVYACQNGAVAAPTAGLHFSKKVMEKLKQKGVTIIAITLHVGYGTFSPVNVNDIRDHKIHSEWFSIPEKTAEVINHAKKAGNRIIAVGTTTVRTLEYGSDRNGTVLPGDGNCDLFIYPGYRFKVVDAMVTNFHLPKSTLLMLVSAFAGRETILDAYRKAVNTKYRFFSYGDAMFIA